MRSSRWLPLLWLGIGALLAACSSQPPSGVTVQIDREFVSHSLRIDVGEERVLSTPQRAIRISEHLLHQVTERDAKGRLLNSYESHRSLPWDEQSVSVIADDQHFTLLTDNDGIVRLNLLDERFVGLDFDNLRVIQLVARAEPSVVAEQNLLISRELRAVLREAVILVHDNLEESDVEQWVYRINRLSELDLKEESNQLENMLILLTVGDPELQAEFVNALENSGTP